jgi:hypothetical protein
VTQDIALSPTRFSWSGSIAEFSAVTDGATKIEIDYVESTEVGARRN